MRIARWMVAGLGSVMLLAVAVPRVLAESAVAPDPAAPVVATDGAEPEGGAVLRRLDLAACLETAFEKHPDVQAIRLRVERSMEEARSVRGSYFPVLSADAKVLVWDSALEASLGEGGAAPTMRDPLPDEMPQSGFDNYMAEVLMGLEPLLQSFGDMGSMTIRDQVTWGVTFKLMQPLTPLYSVFKGHEAKQRQTDLARVHGDTVRADVGIEVAKAYYAALQAEAYVVIAGSAVDQLQAHTVQATAFFEQGVIGKSDVLKVELELSNAQQQLVLAESGRDIARANLAAQMGLNPSTPIAPAANDPGAGLSPVKVSLAEAIEGAMKRRTELIELAIGEDATRLGAEIAWWDLVPKVVLLMQYDHSAGMGDFSTPDTFFAGLALTWEFWDWGKTYYAAKAADMQVDELKLKQERVAQLLRLDVTAKYLRMRGAEKAYGVANKAIVQAEEALRIERERFSAQVATSTDVLDAEANLTRARANQVNAFYSYQLAFAELRRAMGEPIAEAKGERP